MMSYLQRKRADAFIRLTLYFGIILLQLPKPQYLVYGYSYMVCQHTLDQKLDLKLSYLALQSSTLGTQCKKLTMSLTSVT